MDSKTIIATQTAINDIYRAALLDLLEARNEPADNWDLCEGLLGGIMPAEMQAGAMEPYIPAMLSLADEGKIAYWESEDGIMLADLATRVTDAEMKHTKEALEDCKDAMRSINGSTDFDDPRNHRFSKAQIDQKRRERAEAEANVPSQTDIEAMLRRIIEGAGDNNPTVH